MNRTNTLVVSANFAADPLVEPLELWSRELDLGWNVELAPYDQVFQGLLDPASALRRNRAGTNVVLLRLQDLARGNGRPLERDLDELARAIAGAARESPVAHLVCVCPPSSAALAGEEPAAEFARHEERLVEALADATNVEVVTGAELLERYPVEEYDNPKGDRLAHLPYTEELFTALATLIARRVSARLSPAIKVIALDCDQTLWRGVCGEVGAEGVAIEEGHVALQRFVLERRHGGVLLVLCSKNNEEDVWAVFERRDDMLLRPENLAATRLNWRPKSENLRELADELNLGLDSFVLLDDDPVACAEVIAGCPEVLTLRLPPDPKDYEAFLEHVWPLDTGTATTEDAERTRRYRQESVRREARGSAPSFAAFIESLELDVRIESPRPEQLPRVAQLTVRTNQFNLTGVRRTEEELRALLSAGELEALVVDVSDRFGDYGLVGALLFRRDASALVVDTFLLSCRALGRGVEHRMLAELGRIARERGQEQVAIPFRPTEKNTPAAQFLESVVGEPVDGSTTVSSEQAAGTTFRPVDTASASREHVPVTVRADTSPRHAAINRIATELRTARDVLSAVEAARAGSRPRDAEHVAPRTGLEQTLAELWSTQLGISAPGVHDDFFASGGHSLQAALFVAQASEAFAVEVSLLEFFDAPTIAGLAVAVERRQIATFDADRLATALEEVGGLSDEEVLALLSEEPGRAAS